MSNNQNLDWEGLYKSILALKEEAEIERKKSREEADLERKKIREEIELKYELERKRMLEEAEIERKKEQERWGKWDEERKKSTEKFELELQKSTEKFELELQKSTEKWEIESKESNRKINKVAKMIGNHTRNAGDVAEEFFYRGLAKAKKINNLKFDVVRRKNKNIKEYDIVMVNGDSVAVISVKFKLHTQDIEDFIKKDLPIFRKEFPEFRNYKLYGGIASMCVPDELEKQAEEAGLFVFTQSGDKPKLLNSDDFEAKVM